MKILWLVSWYPNRKDRFDGDFIQRHARAAAIYHDVHVIFVTDAVMEKEKDEEWNYATGLTEQIIYFRKRKGIASRLRKQLTWRNIYRKAIKNYITKNGLPDLVHVHVPWKAGLIALWMKKKYGLAFIVTEHWGYYNKEIENNFFTYPGFTQKLVRRIYREAQAFTTVSKFLASEVENVTRAKVDLIISNVVDTTLFFYKSEKYSKFTFIHVSNMVYWKNIKKIIEAFIKVRNNNEERRVQLILVGNRDDRYIEIAKESGLLNDCIFFRGEIPYNEVAEEIRRAHCHVLFGNFETFSCVTAESLCSGVPVIVPSAGAANELVNEKNGLIVPKDDVQQLSNAMLIMMDDYRRFNPISISKDASQKFNYSAIAQNFDELYQQQENRSRFI